MEDREIIKEFVIESNENLERLDREMESRPDDAEICGNNRRETLAFDGCEGKFCVTLVQTVPKP